MNEPIFVKFKSAKGNDVFFEDGRDVWIDITKIIMFYEHKPKSSEEKYMTFISFVNEYGLYIDGPLEDVKTKIDRAIQIRRKNK